MRTALRGSGEVFEGLLSTTSAVERRVQLDELMLTLDVIAPDLDIARHYAEIRLLPWSKGLIIPDNDIWSAATARACDLTLVSRDEHFRRVPNIRVATD